VEFNTSYTSMWEPSFPYSGLQSRAPA